MMREETTRADVRLAFASRLRQRIDHVGLTQTELSRQTGVGRIAINAMCNAKRLPTFENARKIAVALNCAIGDLIPGYEAFLQDTRARSPILIDPIKHPGRARITIYEWLPLDVALQILDLWKAAKARGSHDA